MVVAKKNKKVGQHQQVIFPAMPRSTTTSWNNTEASTSEMSIPSRNLHKTRVSMEGNRTESWTGSTGANLGCGKEGMVVVVWKVIPSFPKKHF
jgi:hypothetical protein